MLSGLQKNVHWRFAGKSDVGVVRLSNEDAFVCDIQRGGYLAIADGVGGLEFGDRASQAAVEGIKNFFDEQAVPVRECPDFLNIFQKIDADIDALGTKLVPGFGIATTLDVAVAGENNLVHFAHLGDSAIFLFRENVLTRISDEHTMAAEEISRGNHTFPPAYANTLTRALGIGGSCVPQVFSLSVKSGDRLLLATDGITRSLALKTIEEIVGDPAGTPESVADALIRAANAIGGSDNSTAVLAFI